MSTPGTVRVGAVDCGTNSIRLLVADISGGELTDVVRTMRIVRLGQGVDETGRIAPEAMQRTLEAAEDYARQCKDLGVDRVRFVATSASRDASNAQEFIDGVRGAFAYFGASPEVISGDEEATLSFRGATGDLARAGHQPPYLVVDLGGGSTEFVRGTEAVEAALSVDIGCVRLTERHLRSDPPTPEQIRAATDDINAAIDRAEQEVGFGPARTIVGLAGSITTITAHALGLTAYDAKVIHGTRLPVAQVIDACTDLLGRTREQRAALGFMHPGRVDVIGAGALVWRTIVDRVAQSAGITHTVTNEKDILDGIALSQVR
ncbi:Ppx/GppA family phosphatase [Calidifontibacter sp. DB0510]|uniref:Ppx/GppA family phosphatase n=1 Tax=Metallococcus carri TaxID=1656884 RepID=A0A967E8W3_9MICO|nr:Ppx/GppA phosphatase family protein [Metallococcus carri]NHN55682.1 Ppx/GppA family phosphatase [Metallococcus carri]NOP38134.1 Ppx/GppA family phosphatase [Calidifontibacter sp. DB2511S]